LIDFAVLSERCPKTAKYFMENKARLENREHGKMRGKKWYGYIYLKNMARQSFRKICVPRLVDNLHGTYDESGTHFLDNVDVGGLTMKPDFRSHSLGYLLALINSRLWRWYFPQISAPFRGGWRSANRQFLSLMPFQVVDFKNSADDQGYGKLSELAEQESKNQEQSFGAKTDKDKTYYEQKCAALDRQIDDLVYKLYGLTDDEIRIVEAGQK